MLVINFHGFLNLSDNWCLSFWLLFSIDVDPLDVDCFHLDVRHFCSPWCLLLVCYWHILLV